MIGPNRLPYFGDRPKQKLHSSDKTEDWGKDNIDWVIAASRFERGFIKGEMLYQLYNNIFPEKLFHYVENPYNSTRPEYTQLPARIRPYTILRPTIDLFLGEFKKRPFDYQVSVKNTDSVEIMREERYQMMLSELGQIINDESKDHKQLEEAINNFAKYYQDSRAIVGQNAVEYILHNCDVFEKLNDMFKDFLIYGTGISYKTVEREDIVYECVNPLGFYFDNSSDIKYIEDADWACKVSYMSPSEVLDDFYDYLTEEEINRIDSYLKYDTYAPSIIPNATHSGEFYQRNNSIEVVHCVWKTFKAVYIDYYIDEFGNTQEVLLPDTWKPIENEKLEKIWITEVWEGYRIDRDIYTGLGPIIAQRNQINNKSSCKLPYNGKLYSNRNAPNISVLELGVPYQVLYVIILYQIELTLQKNHGKILLLDKGAIPESWEEEKFIYMAKALGFAFINPNQISAAKHFNNYQALDMSTLQHVSELINIANYIKQSWEEVVGVNQQRKGSIQASENVGNVQQAVFQSSIISEELFTEFDDFVQKEMEGLLDISKLAWRNGKKALFIDSELRSKVLQIFPEDYIENDFGLVISNSYKNSQTLSMLKQQAQSFAQNGTSPLTTLEILNSNNISKLSQILRKEQERIEKMQQQAQEQESEMQQQQQQYAMQLKQYENDFLLQFMNAEYDRKEAIEYIKGEFALHSWSTGDSNMNQIPDANEIELRQIERDKIRGDRSLKQRELDLKERDSLLKAATEKYKSDNQLQIAKTNKNKYDV